MHCISKNPAGVFFLTVKWGFKSEISMLVTSSETNNTKQQNKNIQPSAIKVGVFLCFYKCYIEKKMKDYEFWKKFRDMVREKITVMKTNFINCDDSGGRNNDLHSGVMCTTKTK